MANEQQKTEGVIGQAFGNVQSGAQGEGQTPPAQSVNPGAVQGSVAGLPPTGLQQQLASLNQQYESVRNIPKIGFDPRVQQLQQGQQELQGPGKVGQTSLGDLARSLAESYGLPLGRGSLVDDQGNFLMTPDQLAAASGGSETIGTAAAKMNYIAEAIGARQQERSFQQGVSAMQTGIGLVQERGRGSLANLQSGHYAQLGQMYANKEYESADFSYFIEKEKMDIAQDLMRRREELAKKQARMGMIGGIVGGILGFATGNVGMGIGGISSAFGAAGGTGWF